MSETTYLVAGRRLPAHPAADVFPAGDANALAADIRERGQRVPVVLTADGETVLDGRTRLLACERVGREPVVEYAPDGTDPVLMALSMNINRRHMTQDQKALAVADLETLPRGRPKKDAPGASFSTRSELCAEAGVGERTVGRAASIKADPVLAPAVRKGHVSLKDAAAIRREPEERKRAAVAAVAAGETKTAKAHVGQATGKQDWNTPAGIVEAARQVLGGCIDLDPASNDAAQRVVGAARWISAEEDALAAETEWAPAGAGVRVYMNPPYATGLVGRFVARLLAEMDADRVGCAVVLVNNATETAWGQKLLARAGVVCFPAGRVHFVDAQGGIKGSPLQGQMIAGLGVDSGRFRQVFGAFGRCR